MNKTIKYLLTLFIIGIAVASIFAYMLYNKPHRDVSSESVSFTFNLDEITQKFEENDAETHALLNEKVIAITGTVSKIEDRDTVIIFQLETEKFVLFAEIDPTDFVNARTKLEGDQVELKGLYVGYNEIDVMFDMPGDILLKRCYLK
jgi:hypothetical protein